MPEALFAGRYRLLEPLGRGAMSSVWDAVDEELDRHVAVKTLAPNADRPRFEREARAAAALSHPNIVGLYDYGDWEGRPFMVLERLGGGSLEERLRDERPLQDDDVRRIAGDVAAGLAHAHERGLVHRDLKPANILFDGEGRAKIADFGIARMRGTGTLTETGTVLGTASYISPEQAGGEPAGPASDVYSFGVILFRLLTGRLPFEARNAMELVRMHRDAAPPLVGDLRGDAPADLSSLAGAALAKDPAARPADGAALLARLHGEDTAVTIVTAPVAPAGAEVVAPGRAGSRWLVAGALAVLVLAAGGAALAVALTRGGGGGGGSPSVPSLTLPVVSTAASEPTGPASTAAEPEPTRPTAPTTTAEETTAPATTARSTTEASTSGATTSGATTAPVTTSEATTTPVTTGGTTTAAEPATTTTLVTTAPTAVP